MDLDSWVITIFPGDLLQIWSDVAPLQLVSHSPVATIKDDDYYHDWVFIGQCGAYLRIAPEFKRPLFIFLVGTGYQIILSDFPTAFIRGTQVIHFNTLVEALEDLGCTAVRVQAFGMKQYLPSPYNGYNFGNIIHPLAMHNNFDLGINYSSNDIALVKPRYSSPMVKAYPMLVPISKGFGTVNMALTLDDNPLKVKAYPRLVHAIKSIAGNQMFSKPANILACRKKQQTLQQYIHMLNKLPASQLGGLRLEVTVNAPNLQSAINLITTAGILDINQFTEPTSELMMPYKILQMRITKEEFITNCQTLMATAHGLGVFTGHNQSPVPPPNQQVLVDLYNAVGWNNGRNRPTLFDKPNAWWVTEEEEADFQNSPASAPVTMHHITGVQPMRDFFTPRRSQLPCHNCQHTAPTYILTGGKRQFKITCTSCKSSLTQQKARDYFNTLLADGTITLSDSEAPPATEEEPPVEPTRPLPALPAPAPLSDEEDEEAPPRPPTRRRRAATIATRRTARLSKRRRAPANRAAAAPSPPAREDSVNNYSYGINPFVELFIDVSDSHSPSPASPSPAPQQPAPKPRRSVTFAANTKPPAPSLRPISTSIPKFHRLGLKFAPKVSQIIAGDGNCMFRAVSLHLYGTQDRHLTIRGRAVHHLRQHPELMAVVTDSNYLTNMDKEGTWGDELMLQAIAAAFNISLYVSSAASIKQGIQYSVTYPASAPGPHYGLFFFQGSQHYEILF